jgi:hypothetical protein
MLPSTYESHAMRPANTGTLQMGASPSARNQVIEWMQLVKREDESGDAKLAVQPADERAKDAVDARLSPAIRDGFLKSAGNY